MTCMVGGGLVWAPVWCVLSACSIHSVMEVNVHNVLLGLGMCAVLALSHCLRRVIDPVNKQWITTAVGVLCVVCKGRWRAVHLLVLVAGNAYIILYRSKRNCHRTSFVFSFAYLFFYQVEMYYNLFGTHAMINITMMMAVIRLVHLAGEVEDSFKAANSHNDDADPRSKICLELSPIEIFHFSFCYVGGIAFYRYVTYHDWIHRPLHPHADCHGEVVKRVKMLLVVAPYIFLVDSLLPIKAVLSEDFYVHPFPYKVMYATYAGVLWSLIVAGVFVMVDIHVIASGMGVYPVSTNPRPGKGPTVNLELLEQLANSPEKAQLEKYNFHAIRGIFLYKAAFSPRYREFWRNYNCCSQYFLATNVYKRFAVKKYRLLATFATTAMWHTAAPFWYIAVVFIVGTIATEDLWYSLYRKDATGRRAQTIDSLFWLTRFVGHPIMLLAVTYVENLHQVLRLLGSIYFMPFLFPVLMFALGMGLRHVRESNQQRENVNGTIVASA